MSALLELLHRARLGSRRLRLCFFILTLLVIVVGFIYNFQFMKEYDLSSLPLITWRSQSHRSVEVYPACPIPQLQLQIRENKLSVVNFGTLIILGDLNLCYVDNFINFGTLYVTGNVLLCTNRKIPRGKETIGISNLKVSMSKNFVRLSYDQLPFSSFVINTSTCKILDFDPGHKPSIRFVDEKPRRKEQQEPGSGSLTNTFFFFMSDHGDGFGKFRKTTLGWHEDKLPSMWIYKSPDLREKFPDWTKAIQLNAKRLTSHFDQYHAMIQILATYNKKLTFNESYGRRPAPPRHGQTLLEPIPENRTCEEAGIPTGNCVCKEPQTIDMNSKNPMNN